MFEAIFIKPGSRVVRRLAFSSWCTCDRFIRESFNDLQYRFVTACAQCERKGSTLHDLLAKMLDDEFNESVIDAHVEQRASDIAGGLPNLSVLPCSMRIDDFSTSSSLSGFENNLRLG